MFRLDHVSADEHREYLDEEKRPKFRLVVGINCKEGVSHSDLAEWYGVSRNTIHDWLNRLERLESEPFEEVIYDTDRPERPSKPPENEWNELVAILDDPPSEVGIGAPQWSPLLVRLLLEERFDVRYSRRNIRVVVAPGQIYVENRPAEVRCPRRTGS